jgi:hypothetical protein
MEWVKSYDIVLLRPRQIGLLKQNVKGTLKGSDDLFTLLRRRHSN